MANRSIVDLENDLVKPYIDNKAITVEEILAPAENGTTAVGSYAIGEHFVRGDKLYKAKTAITAGDTLTLNTNYELADDITTQIANGAEDFINHVNANGSKNNRLRFVDCLDWINPSGTRVTSTDWESWFTINDDDTVTIKATPSARKSIAALAHLPAGKYIMNGCPSGGSATTFKIWFLTYDSGSEAVVYEDRGDTPTVVTLNQDTNVVARCDIYGSAPVDQVFKPMICLESDYDLDVNYVAPAESNYQLTRNKVSWNDLSEVGAVNLLDSDIVTQTILNGDATITANADGSYTCSGSVASGRNSTTLSTKTVKLKKGVYKWFASFDGNSSIGAVQGVCCFIKGINGTNDWYRSHSGVTYSCGIINVTQDSTIQFGIATYNNTDSAITFDETFYPAIYPVSYNGDYVPYAKTNKELTDVLSQKFAVVTGTLANGNVSPTVPAGFNAENSVVVSMMVKATDSRWYTAGTGNIDTTNNTCATYPNVWWDGNSGLRVLNYYSPYVDRPFKICLMRTDI